MKLILVHGDNTPKIHQRINTFVDSGRKRGWQIGRFGKKDTDTLKEELTAISLFDDKKLFIVDGVNSVAPKDYKWLQENENNINATLIIYNEGEVNASTIKKLPSVSKVEKYDLSANIFKFLDSFIPGNTKNVLAEFHELIKKEPVELIVFLFGRHLRDLYWVLVDEKSMIYPDWRVKKLKVQALKLGKEKIKKVIDELARIDMEVKQSNAKLIDSLDLLFIRSLE